MVIKRPAAAQAAKGRAGKIARPSVSQASGPMKKKQKKEVAETTEASTKSAAEAPAVSTPSDQPDWLDESDPESQNEVFLVTAAAVLSDKDQEDGDPLRDPSQVSKEEFQAALFDSISNPIYEQKRGGRPPSLTAKLDVYVGVKEPHKLRPQTQHHHAVLKFLKSKHRFLPFKLAMRRRHAIATHWSTSHKQLWSAVRYVHCTRLGKETVDRKPLVWTQDDQKLNLHDEANEPFQAAAWNRKRELRMSEPFEKKIKKKQETAEKVTKLDFQAMVLERRLLTPSAVLDHVMRNGSKAMQLWTCNRQGKLKEFIEHALQVEGASQAAAAERESDWERVQRLARNPCKCGSNSCVWWSLASDFFRNNPEIDRQRLAAALRKIIQLGPSKDVRVPTIIGEPNCAKSTVLDNVRSVFGQDKVLSKPKLGAPNGALSKLAKDDFRFVFWDDYRPVEYAAYPEDNPTVPATDFLAFFQGQPFNIQVSQSFNDGHPTMTWHRGVAMTCKEEGLWDPIGIVTREEIKHMKARVDIFRASHVVGTNPDLFDTSPACAEPWCRWILVDSVAYAARQGPTVVKKKVREPLALPPLPGQTSVESNAVVSQGLTGGVAQRIRQNREKALQRKRERQGDTGEGNAGSELGKVTPTIEPSNDMNEITPDPYAEFDDLEDPWASEPM